MKPMPKERPIPDGLTTAQREIREAGIRRYNGRATKPLEALYKAGLIEYEMELVPVQNMRFTILYTCRPAVGWYW